MLRVCVCLCACLCEKEKQTDRNGVREMGGRDGEMGREGRILLCVSHRLSALEGGKGQK